MQTNIQFTPNTYPPLLGTNAAESIAVLQQATDTMMHFGSLYSPQLFDLQSKELAAHHVAGAIRYRPELWGIACKLSRSISPYISNHVRGNDGPFKNRKNRAPVETAEFEHYVKHELTTQMDALRARFNQTPCLHTHAQGGGEDVGKVIRLLVVTDLSVDTFVANYASTEWFQTMSNNLAKMVGEAGWGLKLATTKSSIEVRHAVKEMESKWYMQHMPPGFAQLLLDILLATLADYGFVGNPHSTLTHHIENLREHNTRQELCAAHDAADDHPAGCTANTRATMDMDDLDLVTNKDPVRDNSTSKQLFDRSPGCFDSEMARSRLSTAINSVMYIPAAASES
jgi:hypothetical protein